jgi:hypothetical protein
VAIAQPEDRETKFAEWFPSMSTRAAMQTSWHSFFANDDGVRAAFLSMTPPRASEECAASRARC